mmetsp:Transcript_961/g.2388  ORF Transcript_961/g.2388 Transcript_961/m.2388 type:complete len:232 (-) Transcript_961:276-971(-)
MKKGHHEQVLQRVTPCSVTPLKLLHPLPQSLNLLPLSCSFSLILPLHPSTASLCHESSVKEMTVPLDAVCRKDALLLALVRQERCYYGGVLGPPKGEHRIQVLGVSSDPLPEVSVCIGVDHFLPGQLRQLRIFMPPMGAQACMQLIEILNRATDRKAPPRNVRHMEAEKWHRLALSCPCVSGGGHKKRKAAAALQSAPAATLATAIQEGWKAPSGFRCCSSRHVEPSPLKS